MTAPYSLNQAAPICQSPYTCQEQRPSFRPLHPPLPVSFDYPGYQPAPRCEPCPEILQIDANQPLVNFKDFSETFAIPFMYGDRTKPWPNTCILLYKYSSNSCFKYSEIPENTWKRRDNNQLQHAEQRMIDDLNKIQEYIEMQPDHYEGRYKCIHNIEVIQSYSPCSDCSDELCSFKEKLNFKIRQNDCAEAVSDINFKITFSNFYKHSEELYPGTGDKNMEGLKNLSCNGIHFDVFTDDNWHEFPNIDLYRSCLDNPFRKIRQEYDKEIRQELEKL